MTQQLGNGGMFMEGMGMMGQAAMGQFQAMRQNVSNLLDTTPQKIAQVGQQRNGFSGAGGGGAMNPNAQMLSSLEAGPGSFGPNVPGGPPPTGPGGGYVGPSPAGGGNNPPPPDGSGGGNKGGGGGGKGGGPAPSTGMDGNRGGGGINFNRGGMFRGAANIGGIGLAAQGIAEGEVGKGVLGGGGLALGAQASRMGGSPLAKLAFGVGGAALGLATGQGVGSMVDRKMAESTGQDPSGKYNQEANRYQQVQSLNTMLAGINDIQRNQLQNDMLRMQAMEPVVNRMQDKMLVRQQAMNASLTNSYAMLGALSTAGKMAQQGQLEAGANFRTAMLANPYSNSTVQAPSISF